MLGDLFAAKSRWYSWSKVSTSYSGWPDTYTCLPFPETPKYKPTSLEEAKTLMSVFSLIISSGKSQYLEIGALNTSSKPRVKVSIFEDNSTS